MNSCALAAFAAAISLSVSALAGAEGDVRRDRVVEQVVLLEHEADLPAQRPVVERAHVVAVEGDRALGRLEQPGEAA